MRSPAVPQARGFTRSQVLGVIVVILVMVLTIGLLLPNVPTLTAKSPRAGVFGYDRRTTFDEIEDGTSNTAVVMESEHQNGPWARGGVATVRALDTDAKPYTGPGREFGGTHFADSWYGFGRGKYIGFNALMADGSVRMIGPDLSPHGF